MAPLLEDCQRSGYYDRFLDDLVPVLIEKLVSASGDPLKRAKEELGALGADSVQALSRLVDQTFTNAGRSPNLENALDALSLNSAPGAHDVLVHALDHVMESVRSRAMTGLIARHARAEDFGLYHARFQGNEPQELRRLYLRGMFAADPVRAQQAAIGWMREGEHLGYHLDMAQQLASATDADVAAGAAELLAGLDPLLGSFIAAPAARFGHENALAYLREELEAEDQTRRTNAVRAFQLAGLPDELEPALEDPAPVVLSYVIDALAQAEPTPRRMDWLRGFLNHDAQSVREQALHTLCGLKDPTGIDQALSQLGENPRRLEPALRALNPVLSDPELARRAYVEIIARHELEVGVRTLSEQAATFKAMGIVQLPEAAAFLRRAALEAEQAAAPGEVAEIDGLRAHAWLMIQASNTGLPGRTFLWEELATETDPLRRIDLIDAITSFARVDEEETAIARERLLSLCEGGAHSELELLFAVRCAIRVGPSTLVAPRVKLVVSRIDTPRIQVALQCLLWKWY